MTYIPVPPFRFIEAREGYSRYDDSNGEPCYFANRTFNTGPTYSYYGPVAGPGVNELNLDMAIEASEVDGLNLEETRALVPSNWRDDIVQCEKCDNVASSSETTHVDGDRWCESCVEDHDTAMCSRCDETVSEYHGVGYDDVACETCSDNHTHFCDECGETVWSEGDHYENHEDEDCDCEAPNQNFTLPVLTDGADPIKSDTTSEVRTQGGLVSEAARNQIHQVVETALGIGFPNRSDYATPEEFEKVWQTVMVMRTAIHPAITQMDHAYKTAGGVYAKRLRSAIHKATKGLVANGVADKQFTIDTATVEKVGQIARENSKGVDVKLSITRDLNQSADFFYHDDSCWWTDYSHSRCTLKNNHGFGVRSLGEDQGWGAPATGRMWVLPCTITNGALHPTSGDAEAYVVFNGYGELSEVNGPQALAALVGMEVSTHRISIDADMYVNSAAYVVTTPEYVGEALHFGAHLYQH